jgi:hypothetical protein
MNIKQQQKLYVKFLNSKLQFELDKMIKSMKMTLNDVNRNEIQGNRTEYLSKIRIKK